MIDICFGDSCAGAMKMRLWHLKKLEAEGIKDELKQTESIDSEIVDLFFSNEKGEYCHSRAICYLPWTFDYCNLTGDAFENLMQQASKQYEKSKVFCKTYRNNYEQILLAAKNGETIRLWYEINASSLSGYYYILSVLKDYDCKIITFFAPLKIRYDNEEWASFNGWGDISHLMDEQVFYTSTLLTKQDIQNELIEWERLVKKNKPLRIMKDEQLLSVDEDYFDEYILRRISERNTDIRRIVGSLMGEFRIPEMFIENRIEYLAKQGKIIINKNDKEHTYVKKKAEMNFDEILSLKVEGEVLDVYLEKFIDSLDEYLLRARAVEDVLAETSPKVLEVIGEAKLRERCIKDRQEYFENFRGNKRGNLELLDKLLKMKRQKAIIDFNLQMGKIDEENFVQNRIKTELELGKNFPMPDYCTEENAREYVEAMLKQVQRVIDFAKQGRVLRIWCSHNSPQMCALYYIMNKLKDIDCTIILFKLPLNVELSTGKVVKARSFFNIPSKEIGACICGSSPHIVKQNEKLELAAMWDELVIGNAELRVSANGIVRSKQKDYYQYYIKRFFFKKPFKLYKLLDNVEKKFRDWGFDDLSVDFWIKEIFDLVQNGTLEVVKMDKENIYQTVLKVK